MKKGSARNVCERNIYWHFKEFFHLLPLLKYESVTHHMRIFIFSTDLVLDILYSFKYLYLLCVPKLV